jgi:streptogramin lyase
MRAKSSRKRCVNTFLSICVSTVVKLIACVVVILAATAGPATAHPPVGIAIAPNGDVFYTDLANVWRITASGEKTIVVPNVHAHDLSVDSSGSLVGEDTRWLGGDRYRHRIWRRDANGHVTDIVPWKDGSWREYGFARDAAGGMYWVKCTPARVCTIFKRDRTGHTQNIVSEGRFSGPINWIAASPSGDVYVVDGPDLRRVNRRGKLETVARLSMRTDGRHHLMGMSFDRTGNIYVAAHADRTVFRVSPAGQMRSVARSEAPWAPSGVAVSPGGDLWILEWSAPQARVRRIAAGKL